MGNSALEFAVLAHLERAELTRAELGRRTSKTDEAVRRVLDDLVSDGLVYRRDQRAEPDTFGLTPAGLSELKDRREYAEEQAGREWRKAPLGEPGQESWTWADAQPAPVSDPALEQALIEQLEHAELTRAELIRRTGASDVKVKVALEALVAGTYVSRRMNDGLPPDYSLTAAGHGRLQIVRDMIRRPWATTGKLLFAAVRQQQPDPPLPPVGPPQPRRRPPEEPPTLWNLLKEQLRRGRKTQ